MSLSGKVCLVTGATRGIGKGIALQLGSAGATVYVTGRTLTEDAKSTPGSLRETADEIKARGGTCIPVACDHSNDGDVQRLFEKINSEQRGQLDLLVNNAYGGVQVLMQNIGKPFWDTEPAEYWDKVNNVGLRNHYICSVYAARMMAERKQGLIVNVSSAGGLRYLFAVPYGVGKAAVDRMAADCAVELKSVNVACVSLWPGAVRTEELSLAMSTRVVDKRMRESFEQAESTEFSGMAVVRLMQDRDIMKKTGRILLVSDLASEYGFKDIDGRDVPSMRQVNYLLGYAGYKRLAACIPSFIKLPYWMLALAGNKF